MITLALLLPKLAPTGALMNQHGQAYDLEAEQDHPGITLEQAIEYAVEYVWTYAERDLSERDRYVLANGGTIKLTPHLGEVRVHYPESDWPSTRDAHDEAMWHRKFEPWHEGRAA